MCHAGARKHFMAVEFEYSHRHTEAPLPSSALSSSLSVVEATVRYARISPPMTMPIATLCCCMKCAELCDRLAICYPADLFAAVNFSDSSAQLFVVVDGGRVHHTHTMLRISSSFYVLSPSGMSLALSLSLHLNILRIEFFKNRRTNFFCRRALALSIRLQWFQRRGREKYITGAECGRCEKTLYGAEHEHTYPRHAQTHRLTFSCLRSWQLS